MPGEKSSGVTTTVLSRELRLSVDEFCDLCGVHAETVIELVEHGLLEPQGSGFATWSFAADSIRRVQIARRLQRDFALNTEGAALAVELLEEIDRLRQRLRLLEQQWESSEDVGP